MKSLNNKINWRTTWPYGVILVISLLAMFPQWYTNAAYVGIDSLFHMNRFYDAMMQIKTGSYSYFQSFFGFGQSGRVVNAVYGPLFAYFNGFLLLISKNWVNYQLISSALLFIISGCLMYHLSIKNNVQQLWALVIAGCYMFSTPILYWINGQQFTAWGAAFVPLIMLCGTEMIRTRRIAWIKLALSMTLLLEIHNITSAICALALIPFFVTGLVITDDRKQMWQSLFKSIGLTLLLSFNVWGGMLELFSSNHLLPVLPDLHLASDSLFAPNGTTRLQYSTLFLFVIAILYLIIRWKHIDLTTRVIILNGTFFLWIPTFLFPWTLLSKLIPAVDSVIQNPIRFLVIPYVLLYLAIGILLSDKSINWSRYVIGGITILLMLLVMYKDFRHVLSKSRYFNSHKVIISTRKTIIRTSDPNRLRSALRSDDPQRILQLVIKATPDYMPVKQKISVFEYQKFSPYIKYRKSIIKPNINHDYQVKNGIMTVKWTNKSNHTQPHKLAVVKYAHSIIKLNGKQLKTVKTDSIGAITVNGKSGVNHLTIQYQSAGWFRGLIWVSIIGWIGLIGYVMALKG